MNWRKHEDKSNPLIPYFMAKILHTTLRTFTASEQSPAMPTRAKPMNPARGANEDRARKPPTPFQGREEVSAYLHTLRNGHWLHRGF